MLPLHASQMYARNVREFIMELLDSETKELNLDFENEVIVGSAITHGGEVRHGPTKEKLNG
jgi:NAD(P) transhydrogenase subunit alpha